MRYIVREMVMAALLADVAVTSALAEPQVLLECDFAADEDATHTRRRPAQKVVVQHISPHFEGRGRGLQMNHLPRRILQPCRNH